MSMPGFSAQAALYRGSSTYRAASRHHSAPAAVQAAMRVSCHCTPVANDYNWSCTCRWWWSSTCGGYATTYADGQQEFGSLVLLNGFGVPTVKTKPRFCDD